MKYNLIQAVEFDKYAVASYNAIHNTNIVKTDIKEVLKLPKCDLLTYGFPCQDISVAGLQKGINENTRSGLLFEVERLLENADYKPKFLIMENVKNLVGKKFIADFKIWLAKLDEIGYVNYWQVLNAKDYGIPQNRERVFCISIRKDIHNSDFNNFEFPQKMPLKLCLRDMLEDEVDEKYYLSDKIIEKIQNSNFMQEKKRIQETDVCGTLLARDYKDPNNRKGCT